MGFGILSDRMKKVPSVFFFGDDDHARLEETSRWAVNALIAESRDGQAQERLSEQQEKQFLEHPGRYQFAARQERVVSEKLYQGNDFDYALVGIMNIGSGHPAPELALGFGLEVYEVELKRLQDVPYPTPSPASIDAPVDIADLTSRQPWEYGILSQDYGEYKDTAYPMSLSFRPMSTMHMADAFLPARSRRNSVITEAKEQYTLCIISAPVQRISENEKVKSTFEDLRTQLGLLDGRDGLREVRVLRDTTPGAGLHLVGFVCSKSTASI